MKKILFDLLDLIYYVEIFLSVSFIISFILYFFRVYKLILYNSLKRTLLFISSSSSSRIKIRILVIVVDLVVLTRSYIESKF